MKKGDISLSEEEYVRIIQKKTASLFSLCTQSGAILGDKDKESEEKLTAYGMNIGISFQLIDDIFDYVADEEKLGKPVGIDLKDRKMTLPMIHALRNSTEEEKKEVKKIFSNSNLGSGDLDYCINLIQKYDSYNYTFQLAKKYGEQAKECLKAFKPSVFSEALYQISDYIISRNC
jgi:geranylgeranyl pyrophosphate synthase